MKYKTGHVQESHRKIEVSKSIGSGALTVVGVIELHELSPDVVTVHGRLIAFRKSGFSTSYVRDLFENIRCWVVDFLAISQEKPFPGL